MAAVRLPPVRERKRPNGDGFAPRPMIRTRKGGASERGAPGGKPRRGKPQPTASPPRQNPRAARPEGKRHGGQRRARSPAGDVTARPRAGAAPGRAYYPRAQRAECKVGLREATAPRIYQHRGIPRRPPRNH